MDTSDLTSCILTILGLIIFISTMTRKSRQHRAVVRRLAQNPSPQIARTLAEYVTYKQDRKIRRIALAGLGQLTQQEAIDEVWKVWAATRHVKLAKLLVEKGWVASAPLELRCLSALKVKGLALIPSNREAIACLLVAHEDPDPGIVEQARLALNHLQKNEEVLEILADLAIQGDHPLVYRVILETQYTPRNPERRAVLFFLTGQWDRYEQADLDRTLLKKAYHEADNDLRQRIIRAACRQPNEPRAINTLCAIWAANRQPDLARLIIQNRWVASAPVEVQVLSALKVGDLGIVTGGGPTIADLLIQATCDADPVIAKRAGLALNQLTNPATQERVCHLVIASGPLKPEISLNPPYAPSDPPQRALFYFFTGQWAKYEQSDPDQAALQAAYREAAGERQQQIARGVAAAGREAWWDIIDPPHWPIMTNEVWQRATDMLVRRRRWNKMWQLVGTVPLGRGLNLLSQLKQHNWLPAEETERTAFQILVQLAELCDGSPPQWSQLGQLGHLNELKELPAYHCYLQAKISPDGQILALSSYYASLSNKVLHVWNMPERKLLNTLKILSDDPILIGAGHLLITRINSTSIELRRLEDGQLWKTLEGLDAPIQALTVSKDGQLLVSGDKGGVIRLWSLPEGRLLKTFQLPSPCRHLAISDNGCLLLGHSEDSPLHLWQLPEGHLLKTLPIYHLKKFFISPDGSLLVTCLLNEKIQLWQLPEGKLLKILSEAGGYYFQLVISLDSRLLITSNRDNKLQFYQLPSGQLLKTLPLESQSLALSPPGRLLALTHQGQRKVSLVSLPDSTLLQSSAGLPGSFQGLVFSRSDSQLLVLRDRSIQHWQIESQPLSQMLPAEISQEHLSWAFDSLRSGQIPAAEQFWFEFLLALIYWQRRTDSTVQNVLARHLQLEGVSDPILHLALVIGYVPREPQQQALFYFLTKQWDKYEAVDFDHRYLRTTYEAAEEHLRQRLRTMVRIAGRTDLLTIITGNDDDFSTRMVNAAETDLLVNQLAGHAQWDRLWDLAFVLPFSASVKILHLLAQQGWQPHNAADQPTFQTLAALALNLPPAEEILRLAPLATQQARFNVPGRVNDLAFSPQQPVIAVGAGHQKVVLWNFQTGQCEQIYGLDHSIGHVTFTPENTLFVTERSSSKNTSCGVYCWNDGQKVSLGQHLGSITDLEAIGSDQVLTTGRDQRVVLWSRAGKVAERTLPTWARAACVSSNGQQAALLHKGITLLSIPQLETLAEVKVTDRLILGDAVFTRDAKTLVIGRPNGRVITFQYKGSELCQEQHPLVHHDAAVQDIDTALNGTVIITADAEGSIYFTAWPSRILLGQVHLPGRCLTSLRVSPEGAFMAVGEGDTSFSLWDLRSLSLSLLLCQSLSQAQPLHLSWLLTLLKTSDLPLPVQQTLCYLEAILRHRFRYDIEVEAGPDILVGEFDIEIE